MAKGTDEKNAIINAMLSTFPGSFVTAEGKEIRIPMNGVEIKVALTAAKDVLGGAPAPTISSDNLDSNFPLPKGAKVEVTVTEDEKANIKKLMEELNL